MIYPNIYINGEILPQEKELIPVYDLGLLRGLGIFDYFRVLDGIPVFAEDHIERLENSLRIMDFKTGLTAAQWHALVVFPTMNLFILIPLKLTLSINSLLMKN